MRVSSFIPVKSFTQEPATIIGQIDKPIVGIRWGKASKFEHQSQGKKPISRIITKQSDDDDDDEIKEENEIIDVSASTSMLKTHRTEGDDVEARMATGVHWTNVFTFSSTVTYPRIDAEGRRQLPATVTTKYMLSLKLHEDV